MNEFCKVAHQLFFTSPLTDLEKVKLCAARDMLYQASTAIQSLHDKVAIANYRTNATVEELSVCKHALRVSRETYNDLLEQTQAITKELEALKAEKAAEQRRKWPFV